MRTPRRLLTALLFALLPLGAAAQDQPAVEVAPATPSPRNASYRIEVTLDAEARTLEGRQTLTWRNLQQQPTDELWFHLYWNAWRNERSTWMLEDRYRGRSDRGRHIREEDWGYVEVDSVDPQLATRFASPDDGNPDDRTVFVVTLPEAVAPGESIAVEMTWHAKIPRTFARTGFRGDYYFLAHWFPKLGVFEQAGWNCHQYHAATEYYSDYGVYDVSMTVPEEYVLGASGRRVDERNNGDGTVTYRHVQEDIHAFTWTASPDYVERLDRFEHPRLPPVDIRLLMQGEHLAQAERHLAATKAALEHYGLWYGPYPYGHVTVIDPAWGSGAGGMEYPTLFTCGTRLFNPFGGGSPEGVTIHEAGHQFWYGVVGNNEFEHAWIDEGLNTFSTGRTYDAVFGDRLLSRRFFRPPGVRGSGFFPYLYRDIRQSWAVPARRLDDYREAARSDVEARPTYLYHPKTAADITYDKTALWLATLERHLGWETLRRILSTFYQRFSFRHPRPEDFLAVVDEVAGQDLAWFFDQVYFGAAKFDYAVESVSTGRAPARGIFEESGGLVYRAADEEDSEADALYRSEIVVRRMEDGVFPVDVLMAFEDGSEVRERWDGADLWKLWVYERPAKLEYAVVDPDRVLLLDLDYTNNSRRAEGRALYPAVKWAAKWLVWFQDLLGVFAFFG